MSASRASWTYPPDSRVTSTDELDFFKMLFNRGSTSFWSGWLALVLRSSCGFVDGWNCDSDPLVAGTGEEDVPVGRGSSISSAPRGCSDSWRLTRSPRPVLCRLKPDKLTLALRILGFFLGGGGFGFKFHNKLEKSIKSKPHDTVAQHQRHRLDREPLSNTLINDHRLAGDAIKWLMDRGRV